MFFVTSKQLKPLTIFVKQAWINWASDADWACRGPKTSEGRTFCLVKKKSSFDLQISSQIDNRGGSRIAATSKMELFVIIYQPLTIITKSSIFDVAVVLDPPLVTNVPTIYKQAVQTSPNQWTEFYMIGNSVMKELISICNTRLI